MVGRVLRSASVVVALLVAGNAAAQDCADDSNRNPLAPVAVLVEKPVNPVCKAEPATKTYPKGQWKTWYGRTVSEVRCHYVCTSDNFPTMTLEGSRTVSFFSERGWELSCHGIPYREQYNNSRGWFVLVPEEPKTFNPAKSDVKELKDWAAGKPWGTN